MIRYDIDLALFGVSEARKNLIAKDPQAQFALNQFPDAVRLTRDDGTQATRAFGPTYWGTEIELAPSIGAC